MSEPLIRPGAEFVAEVPADARIGTFCGMVVVASPLDPPRLVQRRPDGTYQVVLLNVAKES